MENKQEFRVCVTGGRNFTNRQIVRDALDALDAATKITHLAAGGATGADEEARLWCMVGFTKYKADWLTHGLHAGSIRNAEMLDDFKPDLLVAFPGGVGTADCVQKAIKRGIPVRRYIVTVKYVEE